jgi:hypothetical protein
MDKRSEPRFQIRSSIKIAAMDHPEQLCEALLLDVSGAGLKIVSDNWWPLKTLVVIELENHLVVARVRNIVARGAKFSLGAEKLHSALKPSLPSGVSRTVWHNLLRAEMRDPPAYPEAALEPANPVVLALPEVQVLAVRPEESVEQNEAAPEIGAAEVPPGPSPESPSPAEQLPVEEPAVAQSALEQTQIEDSFVVQASGERSAGEQADVERADKREPLVEYAREGVTERGDQPAVAEAQPAESGVVEHETAAAIPEARPEDEMPVASFQRLDPHPQGLPASREAVVEPASELPVSHELASTEERNAPIPVVPPAAELDEAVQWEAISHETAVAVRRLPDSTMLANPPAQPSNRLEDATAPAPRATLLERVSRPAIHLNAAADPPWARAFPLAPNVAHTDVKIAIPRLAPQFGPAYGMAPTTDVLSPISTMPEVELPEPKPHWAISSAVAAAVIGIVTLAFYYGPFRPKAASAPGPHPAPHAEAPLTIPAVTEAPSAATNAATNSAANSQNPQANLPANTPRNAQANPAPSATQAAIPTQIAAPVQAAPLKAAAVANAPPTGAAASSKPVSSTSTTLTKTAPATTASATATSTTTRRVTVKAASLLWFSACSDGKPAIQRVLQTGESTDIEFRRMTVFKIGNAAAAHMTMDGKPLGVIGNPGTVKLVELTAAGLRELPPTTTPGTECQPMRASAKP